MQVMMVGATGRHAHWVLEELLARGVTVRALVRTEESAEIARRNGASEAVIGDLNDPESLAGAVDGMEGVFHIGPGFAPDEAAMGVAMVDAARRAGVRKFVFSGVIHPAITAMVNHAAKLPVEEALYTSGMDFTVLQPAVFMQNLEMNWDEIINRGRLSMPYSVSSKLCWVDYRDVAEVAAMAMVGDELSYGTFELCAPGLLDLTEIAAIASSALGRQVDANETSSGQIASWLPEGRLRDGMSRMIAHYDNYGLPGGNPLTLRAILGREPRTLRDFFHERASR
ncbi:MAG TPA: NmrA family NAD(P)-binding protein [Mycobacterium sp.]|nr:NmrA family NAD(P)-binding protein [Mycobacterium sp.]